jgi:hypothetical protein
MKELSIQTDIKVLAEQKYAMNLATITCVEHLNRMLNYIICDAQEYKLISMNKGKALDFVAEQCAEYAKDKGTNVHTFVKRVMLELTIGRKLYMEYDPQKSYLHIKISIIQETERLIVSKC